MRKVSLYFHLPGWETIKFTLIWYIIYWFLLKTFMKNLNLKKKIWNTMKYFLCWIQRYILVCISEISAERYYFLYYIMVDLLNDFWKWQILGNYRFLHNTNSSLCSKQSMIMIITKFSSLVYICIRTNFLLSYKRLDNILYWHQNNARNYSCYSIDSFIITPSVIFEDLFSNSHWRLVLITSGAASGGGCLFVSLLVSSVTYGDDDNTPYPIMGMGGGGGGGDSDTFFRSAICVESRASQNL